MKEKSKPGYHKAVSLAQLCLCYTNDIKAVGLNSKILVYADDTVLYKKVSYTQRILDMHDFQQDVNRLVRWFCRNRLSNPFLTAEKGHF